MAVGYRPQMIHPHPPHEEKWGREILSKGLGQKCRWDLAGFLHIRTSTTALPALVPHKIKLTNILALRGGVMSSYPKWGAIDS